MSETSVDNLLPLALRMQLRREELLAEGRYDAFKFVIQSQGDIACIKERLAWYEAKLADPSATASGQPYAPNTSVRLHADGHLAGLRDALTILTQATNGSQPAGEPAPTVTTQPHAETTDAQSVSPTETSAPTPAATAPTSALAPHSE